MKKLLGIFLMISITSVAMDCEIPNSCDIESGLKGIFREWAPTLFESLEIDAMKKPLYLNEVISNIIRRFDESAAHQLTFILQNFEVDLFQGYILNKGYVYKDTNPMRMLIKTGNLNVFRLIRSLQPDIFKNKELLMQLLAFQQQRDLAHKGQGPSTIKTELLNCLAEFQ